MIEMVQPAAAENEMIEKDIESKNLNFAYSIRPIYYFLRFFGVMPFSIVSASDESLKPKIRRFDSLWFAVSISLIVMLIVFTCKENRLTYFENSSLTILALGDNILVVCGMLLGILFIVMDMCNRFKIVKIFNMFTNFDREVSRKTFSKHFIISLFEFYFFLDIDVQL